MATSGLFEPTLATDHRLYAPLQHSRYPFQPVDNLHSESCHAQQPARKLTGGYGRAHCWVSHHSILLDKLLVATTAAHVRHSTSHHLRDLQQRTRLAPLMEGNDEVSKLATSLNAITEQIEQAARTERNAEQRFRRLFSDASHQLRTPLTSLRGFTEILLRGAKDDPETSQRILKLMKNEAERMTRLVNDLLMLTRLDDSTEMETELIDLVDVAIEGVEHAKLLVTDGREVTIYFATQERLGVRANGDRLKQVIHILCDNAIKYGRPAPDGWIRLQLDQQNGHAVVQVIDNGKGVHPDDLPKIFDRFYRGEHMSLYNPSATIPPGAGLIYPLPRLSSMLTMGKSPW